MTDIAKLTTAQWKLLALVGNGLIRRDDRGGRGRTIYTPYRTDTGRAVNSRSLDKLCDLGLVRFNLAGQSSRQVPIKVTDAGRTALINGSVTAGS